MSNGIVLFQVKKILRSPTFLAGCNQAPDPFRDTRSPKRIRLSLQVSDHGTELVASSMMACFEPLDASGRTILAEDVFAFIPISIPGGRQSFALNRQQRIEVNVASTFHPDGSTTGRCDQVNLAT